MKKIYSSKNIIRILEEQNLITEEQKRIILEKEKPQRDKLEKIMELREGTSLKDVNISHEINIVDVIISFRFEYDNNKKRLLGEDMIMEAVAKDIGVEFRKIDPLKLELDIVTKTIPKSFAIKHLIVPLSIADGKLNLAMFDPTNTKLLEDLERVTDFEVIPYLSSKSDILKIINEFYGFKTSVVAAEKELVSPLTDLSNLEQKFEVSSVQELATSDKHIKNVVDYLFHYALNQRASDIHIEPKREKSIVRLRIDGVLHNIYNIPKGVHTALVSRIKSLSRMNIAEKRKPQDGRIKLKTSSLGVEIRVSCIPVAFGEKVVLRILDPAVLFQSLENLGFLTYDLITYHKFLKRSNGIILITGPTGSGKTTTLYSTLKTLATPEKNFITIEDPIEMIH
ncbi:MAG: ATPase, T2SS/T4P/T4SS family, partial [Thermodesulfobacteriota bacterium]|nr:ATPase, T2SS/T4P/T4SS family [Thermodesulfobacteriota bacterium]